MQIAFRKPLILGAILAVIITAWGCTPGSDGGGIDARAPATSKAIRVGTLLASTGEKAVCLATYRDDPKFLIVGVTHGGLVTVSFEGRRFGLSGKSGSTQVSITGSDGQGTVEDFPFKNGFVTVALNKEHFAQFRNGGFLGVNGKTITYADISALYDRSLACLNESHGSVGD